MGFMDWVHSGLDVAGMVPVIGEVADGANAGLYAIQGDFLNAGISVAGMWPLGGQAATGGRLIYKGGKEVLEQVGTRGGKEILGEATEQGAKRTAKKEAAEEGVEEGAEAVAKNDGVLVTEGGGGSGSNGGGGGGSSGGGSNGGGGGNNGNTSNSSRAARREAMREQGIPTSQQPVSQSRNASGREYQYEVPKPGGGTQTKSVQQQTMDRSHPGQPHWEAGTVKTDPITGQPRMNQHGRPRLTNDKSKVEY